ncbi:methyltransferase domain-containing protein [Desulfovibrio desulfuricans]|uniref:methyltransferase domain-containing protein n=1 Tax=Desulfovibrio desulfuricans TaxID=876 RepID=UPI001F475040|nr:methyltransferase domain-containing protein [Desulfovibrio desulfuricans]UIA98861.1 methyltransferase domain-containing protein [Desulfovibrio desulfuricans]
MHDYQPCNPIIGNHRHPSSYGMQNPEITFSTLNLKQGDVFLDAGCGLGDYALTAAHIVGQMGIVHAFDVEPYCIKDLSNRSASLGLSQLCARTVDITLALPLPDTSVTAALLGTVLHIPSVRRSIKTLLTEMHRVLKPNGRLGVIECNWDAPCGPPQSMRMSASRLSDRLAHCGFLPLTVKDFGNMYLALFQPCQQ